MPRMVKVVFTASSTALGLDAQPVNPIAVIEIIDKNKEAMEHKIAPLILCGITDKQRHEVFMTNFPSYRDLICQVWIRHDAGFKK